MASLQNYLEDQQKRDFDYFLNNYDELFRKYGKCYIAIRDMHILGTFPTVKDAWSALSPEHPRGSYILQECDGTENAYTTRIMGVKINA